MREHIAKIALLLSLISSALLVVLFGGLETNAPTSNATPMVSGLRIGMYPKDVEERLGRPISSTNRGIWRYKDGTIAAFQGQEEPSLSFVIGKTAELAGGAKLTCPVPLESVLELMGEPNETVEHFESSEVIFQTSNGILVASANAQSQVYLFKLLTKYPLRSNP